MSKYFEFDFLGPGEGDGLDAIIEGTSSTEETGTMST